MRTLMAVAIFGVAATMAPAVNAQTGPFDAPALSSDSLAAVTATGSAADFARNFRANVDQNERAGFDTTAMIGRVTLDNWFAREGSDIIAAGVLGRPLVLD